MDLIAATQAEGGLVSKLLIGPKGDILALMCLPGQVNIQMFDFNLDEETKLVKLKLQLKKGS